MSVKKFKFVSPGVFTREIDQSQLPADDTAPGPMIIGRLPQGPAMEPVSIRSFEEFVQVFGNPIPGRANGDVWREGNYQGPTYAAYAAQAYLRNSTDGISVVRLAGLEDKNKVAGGNAGWATVDVSTTTASNGGAFGLFICQEGSGAKEGHLAAVWYVASGGAVVLTGSLAGETTPARGIDGLFGTSSAGSVTTGPVYSAQILDADGNTAYQTDFNFDPSSKNFIRKVFNTNPQATNSTVVPSSSLSNGSEIYWLGETYESSVQKKIAEDVLSNTSYGLLMAFDFAKKADYKGEFRNAATGYYFSQDFATSSAYDAANCQRLFRLTALEPGKWVQNNIKVSIEDMSYSRSTSGKNNYSTFSVVLRDASDTDKNQNVIERYSNCSLNPLSENFISKKIGDKHVSWDEEAKVLREYGEYDNISKYVRVELNDAVKNGTLDPSALPFGVEGPTKFSDLTLTSAGISTSTLESGVSVLSLSSSSPAFPIETGSLSSYAVTLKFPEMVLRTSSSAGDPFSQTDSYFGILTDAYLENGSDAYMSRQFSADYSDMVNLLSVNNPGTVAGLTEPQWRFSLDDIVQNANGSAYYLSGSRKDAASLTATESTGWKKLIDNGWAKFTAPLFGGFDGLDITEIEPFRNSGMTGATTRENNYAFNTIRAAIDMIADPEIVEMNVATIPGITNDTITRVLVETCEERGDALAIIDLPDVYLPFTEGKDYASGTGDDVRGSVGTVTRTFEARYLNSSYGCTYYPWVQIQDTATSNSRLWVPPSVAALGTFASSDTATEVWFAPAGFNRGGLTTGAAGLPVLNVSQKLTSKERDTLYDASINPIASFPNEGIVIFGQKTLQIDPSALDRINVRRMMIFVKKQISIFANSVLFDQNVEATWDRFKGLADPFLSSVKTRLGLSDYRLILDNTTTTPDLVDQNIMYAKIFLKPAKAIEYIALDFFITNQGASFED